MASLSPAPNENDTQNIMSMIQNQAAETQVLKTRLSQTEDALREREEALNASERERNGLRRQLADVTNAPQHRPGQRRTRSARSDDQSNDDEPPPKKTPSAHGDATQPPTEALGEEAKQAGRKYVIIGMPWLLVDEPCEFFRTELDPDYDESQRHASEANRIQGQLHEIVAMLPKSLKPYVGATWFAKNFHIGMSSQLSNTAHRIRCDYSEIIWGDDAALMADAGAGKERCLAFADRIGLKPAQNGKPEYYSALNCPILHSNPNREKKFDEDDVFTPLLHKTIYVAIARGKAAARATKASNGAIIHYPQTAYMQQKHHLDHTTAGAIALCAMLSRYCPSEDQRLTPVGPQTQINYQEDFNTYLRILQTGLRTRNPSIRRLFRDWDLKVFGRNKSKYGGSAALPEDVRREEEQAALDAMEAAEPDPESDGGESEHE